MCEGLVRETRSGVLGSVYVCRIHSDIPQLFLSCMSCSHSDFSSILKEIKWPFVLSAVSSKQAETWKKHEKKFSKLFCLLLKLDNNMVSSRTLMEGFQKTSLGEPVVLPLELLLTPLRKRFKYHFTGDKKTNSKEKVYTCDWD